MYGYIYETTNIINGKKYIGQHKGDFDKNYHGSGKLLDKAMKKYGKQNFKTVLIENCKNCEDLDNREMYWIEYYNADQDDDYYNISKGGYSCRGFRGKNNPMFGKHHTQESIHKMSINQSKSSWNKGTHGLYSKEYREKISKANKGRIKSKEECEKISLGLKRYYSDNKNRELASKRIKEAMQRPEVKEKISKVKKGKVSYFKGKHHTEETKRKISDSCIGKHHTEETKKKISISSRQMWDNFSEEKRKEISLKLSKRTSGENNPAYAYYKILYEEEFLYFSGKSALVKYCTDNFNLSEPIVRNLIKISEPYVPTKYDIKHNRNKAAGIIVYKISKQDYYERK